MCPVFHIFFHPRFHSLDALPASEEGMQTMSRELEKSLHQVKMDNLYVPENHKQYRGKDVEKV